MSSGSQAHLLTRAPGAFTGGIAASRLRTVPPKRSGPSGRLLSMALNLRALGNFLRDSLRLLEKISSNASPTNTPPHPRTSAANRAGEPAQRRAKSSNTVSGETIGSGYPGDFRGQAAIRYSPAPDGDPDPGEVVWAWVPYEEDFTKGKDRPVLLVGNAGRYLLAVMLTSKDHDGSPRGGQYVDIGSGSWDSKGRPSEANVGRILQLEASGIRREGAILPRQQFDDVAEAIHRHYGWKQRG